MGLFFSLLISIGACLVKKNRDPKGSRFIVLCKRLVSFA
jgi:hypothetical protein